MKKKENKYLWYDYGGKDIDIKYIIKYLLLCFLEVIYRIICRIPSRRSARKPKYQIGFCTIFKDEAPFLKEWIDYHVLIGVEHFYLYNNNSSDNYMEILAPYMDKGVVTLIDWPETPGQLSAYKHWLANYKDEVKWISFADVDEFYCPIKDINLQDWIRKYDKYPVLLIYWKIFGASSKVEHDSRQFVIEQYTTCSKKLNEVGKQFYNTDYEIDGKYIGIGMHHHLEVKKFGITIPPMNVYGHFVKWNIHRGSVKEVEMQLNHYNTKAFYCYVRKHKKGDSAFTSSWRSLHRFLVVEQGCTAKDYTIQRFLLQLKLLKDGIDAERLF